MAHVFIISGSAGVGKNTLWERVAPLCREKIERVITMTSRSPRPQEKDGVDYYFTSPEVFEENIREGKMIEYAIVHETYYGSTFDALDHVMKSGKNPVYIIEPKGMVAIKPVLEAKWYTVRTIFILPPSEEALIERLKWRGTETDEEHEIRKQTTLEEMKKKDMYDFHIINDDLNEATQKLLSILCED